MKRKNKWFKKGEEASGISFKVILGLIILGVFTFLIIKNIAYGANTKIDTVNSCGALSGSKGICKASCDRNTELELPDFGCTGTTTKCCISKNDDVQDVILPPTYGQQNNDYDFEVLSTVFDNSRTNKNCEQDKNDLLTIKCLADTDLEIPIIINVKKIRENTITVKAYPVIVIKDDGNKVFEKPDTNSVDLDIEGSKELKTVVKIEASDAEIASYLKIYPYALCDEKYCKDMDTEKRGILRNNENSFLTVVFVRELS